MSVAYISDVDDTGTAISSNVTAFAVSGTNPVVVVGIAFEHATATVASVVCGGGLTSSTPVEVKTVRNVATFESIWAIPAPTGTGTITVTFSASVLFRVNYILMQDAHQTTPCPTADAVSSVAATNPNNLTPANLTANDASVGIGANTAGGDAPVFTPNETINDNSGTINCAGGYKLGTGAVTVTWGVVADNAMLAVRVAQAAGGGGLTAAQEIPAFDQQASSAYVGQVWN